MKVMMQVVAVGSSRSGPGRRGLSARALGGFQKPPTTSERMPGLLRGAARTFAGAAAAWAEQGEGEAIGWRSYSNSSDSLSSPSRPTPATSPMLVRGNAAALDLLAPPSTEVSAELPEGFGAP